MSEWQQNNPTWWNGGIEKPGGGMNDEILKQLKSLRDHIAKHLSEPYSDDDVVALDKAITALERQRVPEKVIKVVNDPRYSNDYLSIVVRSWLAAAPEPDEG